MLLLPPAIQAPAPAPASVVKVVARLGGATGQAHMGSGVVVAPGVVATNAHVTARGARVEILAGGHTWPARLRRLDASRDLALLEVPGLDLAPAPLADALPEEGAAIAAWGFPKGIGPRSSPGRIALVWSFLGSPLLQAEVDAAPGSSGGGLFDAQGRLVGLTTFILSHHPRAAFAVPVEWIRALLEANPVPTDFAQDEVRLLREFLARMMAEPGNLPGWLRLTERWTKEAPEDPEAWAARGLALQLDLAERDFHDPKERLAAASATERALNRALELDPAPARTWRALGQVLDLQGRYGESEVAYQEALRRDPQDGLAWEGLATAQLNLKQLEAALASLGKATVLTPDSARAWALRAHTEQELRRPSEAQDHYRIAAALLPIRGSWQLAWGLAALKNGDRAAAQAALDQLAFWKAPEERELRKAMGGR